MRYVWEACEGIGRGSVTWCSSSLPPPQDWSQLLPGVVLSTSTQPLGRRFLHSGTIKFKAGEMTWLLTFISSSVPTCKVQILSKAAYPKALF